MSNDAMMARITATIGQLHGGDREGAREAFAGIWADMGDDPDPFHVCILSHYMADAQDDVRSELEWDLRALQAAARVSDARAQEYHDSLSIKGFYPSLHLNAGDAYFRLGDKEQARIHVRAAQEASQHLADSPLADMTRKAIIALAARVEGTA